MIALVIKILVLAVVGGNLVFFARLTATHFARPDGKPRGTPIVTSSYVFGMLQLTTHALTKEWVSWRVLLGVTFCVMSAWLFSATLQANRAKPLSVAGSKDQPQHLNQNGPYAFVRHPFYVSYLCTWFGSGIISPHAWMLIPAVVMAMLYWRAARAEENKFMNSPLAESYRNYRQQAGMFWPRFPRKTAR